MIPLPKQSPASQVLFKEPHVLLTVDELTIFMQVNGFNQVTLGELLGVTRQAVSLWLKGQRDISETNSRLLKLFIKYPNLLREF